MDVKLLSNRVLIDTEGVEIKKPSGLIISKTPEQGDIQTGVVLAVGPGKLNENTVVPMNVKKGDKVMFQYGNKVVVENKNYILVNEDDILMIL